MRSWNTSEIITLIVGLLGTVGASSCPKIINSQQENNAIVKNTVDEILLTQKVSAINHEAPEFLGSDYDANDLYEVDKMSIEDILKK